MACNRNQTQWINNCCSEMLHSCRLLTRNGLPYLISFCTSTTWPVSLRAIDTASASGARPPGPSDSRLEAATVSVCLQQNGQDIVERLHTNTNWFEPICVSFSLCSSSRSIVSEMLFFACVTSWSVFVPLSCFLADVGRSLVFRMSRPHSDAFESKQSDTSCVERPFYSSVSGFIKRMKSQWK